MNWKYPSQAKERKTSANLPPKANRKGTGDPHAQVRTGLTRSLLTEADENTAAFMLAI